LLLLLPVDFFSPPWLERLLLAPPEAFARLDFDCACGLRLEDDSEDLLLRVAMICSCVRKVEVQP
jgi:hypothetical protein